MMQRLKHYFDWFDRRQKVEMLSVIILTELGFIAAVALCSHHDSPLPMLFIVSGMFAISLVYMFVFERKA